MARKQIQNVEQAARRLAVSKSTLKSIMSSEGQARNGKETLDRILKEIERGRAKSDSPLLTPDNLQKTQI